MSTGGTCLTPHLFRQGNGGEVGYTRLAQVPARTCVPLSTLSGPIPFGSSATGSAPQFASRPPTLPPGPVGFVRIQTCLPGHSPGLRGLLPRVGHTNPRTDPVPPTSTHPPRLWVGPPCDVYGWSATPGRRERDTVPGYVRDRNVPSKHCE